MANDSKIQQAADLIRNASHPVALTGAGVSTPSGIPDFRTPGSGLWERDDPLSVASIWGFVEHPLGFFEWVRPLTQLMLAAQPNPAHHALADLEAMGRLFIIVNNTPTPADAHAAVVLRQDVAVALPKIAGLLKPA